MTQKNPQAEIEIIQSVPLTSKQATACNEPNSFVPAVNQLVTPNFPTKSDLNHLTSQSSPSWLHEYEKSSTQVVLKSEKLQFVYENKVAQTNQ